MKVQKVKQGLARLLVVCMLLGDTMPALAQTSGEEVTRQELEVSMGAYDASSGDMTLGDVTPGDVTSGDVTPGDVTPGDVSPGEPTFGLSAVPKVTQEYAFDSFPLAGNGYSVLSSTVFTVTGKDGSAVSFHYGDAEWQQYGLNCILMDSAGEILVFGNILAPGKYTFYISGSAEDQELSCQIDFSVLSSENAPELATGKEAEIYLPDKAVYRWEATEPGYYQISADSNDVYLVFFDKQEKAVAQILMYSSNVSYLVLEEAGEYYVMFGNRTNEEINLSCTLSKLTLGSLEQVQNTEIAMEYGTWGYSVATGSALASGNLPVSGSNPIPANMEITANSVKGNKAVAIQLDLNAGFDDWGTTLINNYNPYSGDCRKLWDALEINQRLLKADGSNAVTDEKGYLPIGDYKMIYYAPSGVYVSVPFRVKEAVPVVPTGVKLNETSVTLTVGAYRGLVASIEPVGANTKTELTWTSSNPAVATVAEGGWVQAKKVGTATITVKTANGKSASCKITVEQGNSPYYVAFDGNGADTGYMSMELYQYGNSYKLPANTYGKTGYTFMGWNTRADGKGTSYKGQQEVADLNAEYYGVTTFYAQWKANSYTVVFEGGVEENVGVTGTMKSQSFIYDKAAALTANAYKREGYIFAGWRDSYGNLYTDKQQVSNLTEQEDGKVSLTAQWKPVEYKITYVNAEVGKNGVTLNDNPVTFVVTSDRVISLETPVRPGYVFDGWYGNKSMKEADKITQIDCSKTGNVTVYAKWTPKTVKVEFVATVPASAPEGTAVLGTMRDLAVTYGKTKTLTGNAYKIPGYVFAGWNTEPDGKGEQFADKAAVSPELVDLGQESGQKLVLYARWTPVSYAITYNNAVSGKKGVTRNDNPAAFTVEDDAINLTAPERPGYVFVGWYSKASMKEADRITQVSTDKAANVKIYAKWIPETVTIHFDANFPEGQTGSGSMRDLAVTYGKTRALTRNAFRAEGYSFTGWNTYADGSGTNYRDKAAIPAELTGGDETVTLYAQWELTRYAITYVNAVVSGKSGVTVNDNPDSFNMEDKSIVLSDPVRPGYVFGGWYSKASMKEADRITEIRITARKPVKVYAKWTGKTTTVHYEKNLPGKAPAGYAVSGSMRDLAVTYGKTRTLTSCSYKLTGYTFAGWNTRADGEGEAYANKAVIPAGFVESDSVTLYAQWKPVEYKISYVNAVDGKNGVVNENPTAYTVENPCITAWNTVNEDNLVLSRPAKPGYTFQGWYTDKKLTNELTVCPTYSRKAMTFYAKWTANQYVIHFSGNAMDATGTMENVSAIYDKSRFLPVNQFKREGYTFVGWSTVSNPGEDDVIYKNLAFVKNLTTEGAVTLYAQWKEN